MKELASQTKPDVDETRPIRLLFVSDDWPIRRAMARTLTRYVSLEFREAGSNDEAYAILASWRPDAVITDLDRPEADGAEFIERLQSLATTREIPIVVLGSETAHADVEALGIHVAAVLAKPCSERDLVPAVWSAAKRDQPLPPPGGDSQAERRPTVSPPSVCPSVFGSRCSSRPDPPSEAQRSQTYN